MVCILHQLVKTRKLLCDRNVDSIWMFCTTLYYPQQRKKRLRSLNSEACYFQRSDVFLGLKTFEFTIFTFAFNYKWLVVTFGHYDTLGYQNNGRGLLTLSLVCQYWFSLRIIRMKGYCEDFYCHFPSKLMDTFYFTSKDDIFRTFTVINENITQN